MKSLWAKLHKIGDVLHLPSLPGWLVGLLGLVLILRIPSFFEPYNYGDEMVYLTLGQGVRQGLTLYKDIHDNKPPLLYLTAAVAGNLFWFKAILAFWMLVTTVLFYKLSRVLFADKGTQKISTVIFAILTTLPLFEGMTANSELFMIAFIIAAFLILLGKNLKTKGIFFAGVLFGLGTLFKVPAAFDLPVIVFYWIITGGLTDWKKILKDAFILGAGFLFPILLTFAWYFFKGAMADYIKAAFLQNVGYISSFRPGDVQKPFLVRNAPVLFRALIVLAGSGAVWLFRRKLSKKFILISLWTLFALFAVTLSERPYPHYFIQVLAPVSLLLGTLFGEKSFEQSLAVIPLTIALFVPVFYKFYFYPTTSYYLRFVNFATGTISRNVYLNSFNSNTTRNYQIAQFITDSSEPNDKVFMWDPDSPTVYALSRHLPPIKYVVPYHVNDYSSQSEVAKEIAQKLPKFIILTSGNPYPELGVLIKNKYLLVQQIGSASIYVKRAFVPGK